jgi:hypothetical protein
MSPASRLFIQVGLGDVAGIKQELQACLADETSLLTVKVTSGVFVHAFRADADIARLFDVLQGGPWPVPA